MRGLRLKPEAKLTAVADRLFVSARPTVTRWFRKHARDLPWRRLGGPTSRSARRNPYATWVAEIMLQQTQVSTTVPFFERWMRRFPDVGALALASEAEVLRRWAGLGYYARARNLHRAARIAAANGLPITWEGWRALPGIGDYTAGAIVSIAQDIPSPILDGNVVRVFSRLFGLGFLPGADRAARSAYWDLARLWARCRHPGDANEGLMELGALVCVPATPNCEKCPLAAHCRARKRGWQKILPPVKQRPAAELVSGTAVVAVARGRVAMELRPRGGFLAGHFLFPLLWDQDGNWRRQWSARHPALEAEPNDQPMGTVRHSIMNRRYTLTVRRLEFSAMQADNGKSGLRWFREEELAAYLTNSLARKIWRIARGIPATDPPKGL